MRDVKKDYFWNTLSGIISALEAIIMSMLVTRITNLGDAGLLTIAFAIGNLMMTVGKFGVANFHVTDISSQYSFSEYVYYRIISIILMVVSAVCYVMYVFYYEDYDIKKCLVILAIVLIYSAEVFEDVIWREYQRNSKLYVGAKIFCIRWICIYAVFAGTLLLAKNMLFSLILCIFTSWIVVLVGWFVTSRYVMGCGALDFKKERFSWKSVKLLTIGVYPLFISNFLYYYLNNVTKYAIDGKVSNEVMACFGFVNMPIFAIALANNLIYYPKLSEMSKEWNSGNIRNFRRDIYRQYGIILLLAVVVLSGAYVLGIPLLSMLYSTDLSNYKMELMVLLFGSIFLSINGFTGSALTVMRRQMWQLVGYLIAAIIAVLLMPVVANKYGTEGVSVGYVLLMLIITVIYYIVFEVGCRVAGNK